MATPIGHACAGFVLFLGCTTRRLRTPLFALALVVMAVLPDIDLLYGYAHGTPNAYHHQATHSLTFCLLVSFLAAFVVHKKNRTQLSTTFVFLFAAGASHLLIDAVTLDTSYPYGIMLWWPFDFSYVIAPFTVFLDIHRSSVSSGFFASLMNRHNFVAVAVEVALISLLYGAVRLYAGYAAKSRVVKN
ncbi:metal-dependent hydrolase [candidate division KSB1 bacterium]|nr:metal-dependent hydrolase [candidate division KSB1 bacterium]